MIGEFNSLVCRWATKYVPVFEKVISAKKTALWYQIDRRVDLLINLQLSAVIPMVDTRK